MMIVRRNSQLQSTTSSFKLTSYTILTSLAEVTNGLFYTVGSIVYMFAAKLLVLYI